MPVESEALFQEGALGSKEVKGISLTDWQQIKVGKS